MAITASMVKELRDQTGAGMMDCKKALVATDGDMSKAVDWLREKGIAKAAKKAGRATGEGLITMASSADGKVVALASVLCETDFVARGDAFKAVAAKASQVVVDQNPADEAAFQAAIEGDITALIASIGENMKAGRFTRHTCAENGFIGSYIHFNGKIGVLVDMVCGKAETVKNPALAELGKDVAMQVAAGNAVALNREGLDPAVVEHELEVNREKARQAGKPEKIIERIAEGGLKKFCQENCLLDQAFLKDDKKSVAQYVAEVAKSLGDTVTVTGYTRLVLGGEEAK